jgi:hypothetical protein
MPLLVFSTNNARNFSKRYLVFHHETFCNDTVVGACLSIGRFLTNNTRYLLATNLNKIKKSVIREIQELFVEKTNSGDPEVVLSKNNIHSGRNTNLYY